MLVVSLLRLLEAELRPLFAPAGEAAISMKPSDVEAAVQNVFLFAAVWSLGASVDETGRGEFDAQLRAYLENRRAPSQLPCHAVTVRSRVAHAALAQACPTALHASFLTRSQRGCKSQRHSSGAVQVR